MSIALQQMVKGLEARVRALEAAHIMPAVPNPPAELTARVQALEFQIAQMQAQPKKGRGA